MFNRIIARTRNKKTNAVNKTITIDSTSPYRFLDVDGLGPVKAEISTIELASEAGSTYLSSKDGIRNIVLSIGFKPDYSSGISITTLRRNLYEVFTPRSEVDLTFNDSLLDDMTIMGYVESHEPDIFSADPTVQISVLCPDPYFRRRGVGSTVVNVPDASLASFNLPYSGHVPTGFMVEYKITENMPEARLELILEGDSNGRLTVLTAFQIGDIIHINTNPGQKVVRRIRNGVSTSILGYFSGSFSGMKLENGQNYFTFNRRWSVTDFKITYQTLYGGM